MVSHPFCDLGEGIFNVPQLHHLGLLKLLLTRTLPLATGDISKQKHQECVLKGGKKYLIVLKRITRLLICFIQ